MGMTCLRSQNGNGKMSFRILVINSGSTSLKFAFFEKSKCQFRGEIEQISAPQSRLWVKGLLTIEEECKVKDQDSAVELMINILNKNNFLTVDAVSHRIVFGGDVFDFPVIIDRQVFQKLQELSPYDQIHMPSQIKSIELIQKHFPKVTQVACFDTSFHLTMPDKSKMFALPNSLYESGIKRYGFHGLSFESVIQDDRINYGKIIIAHLGSGSSICAIKDGKSIDTTMGLTSLGGIPMQVRSGDLDPGIILFLLRQKKWTLERLEKLLYKESGLQGISGISNMKTLLTKSESDPKAQNAVELFCYSIAKTIGSYVVALQGIDAIVFTGGIGERSSIIRKNICNQLNHFEIFINDIANEQNETLISNDQSKAKLFVIPAQEEKVIAEHTIKLVH